MSQQISGRYSLNEINALCRKAARGAGYSWGLAEEAGHIAQRLASFGLPGVDIIYAVLVQAGQTPGLASPTLRNQAWQAEKGDDLPVCALLAACTLNDYAHQLVSGPTIVFRGVIQPLVLIAPAFDICQNLALCLQLNIDGQIVTVSPSGIIGLSVTPVYAGSHTVEITRINNPIFSPDMAPKSVNVAVKSDCWDAMQAFASRIYVPSSETSRAKGAGAGLQDND